MHSPFNQLIFTLINQMSSLLTRSRQRFPSYKDFLEPTRLEDVYAYLLPGLL
jgi:hypothetical protein